MTLKVPQVTSSRAILADVEVVEVGATPQAPVSAEASWSPKMAVRGLDARAARAAARAVSTTVDSSTFRALDAQGNRDGNVDEVELSRGLKALEARMATLGSLRQPSESELNEARQLPATFKRVADLLLELQDETATASNVADLAHKIDEVVHDASGLAIGNADGAVSAFEVESFIKDRAARASVARRAQDAESASREDGLVDLAKQLLKLVRAQEPSPF